MNNDIKKYYWLVFFTGIVQHMLLFFFPLFFLEIGFNGWESGFLMGILSFTGLVFTFYIGVKSDQVQHKQLITLGFLLYAIFCFSLLINTNFWLFILIFFIGGLGANMLKRSYDSMIFKGTKKTEKLGINMAIYESIKVVPFMISTIISGYLIFHFGFKSIFIIGFLIILLLIIPVQFIKETSVYKFGIKDYFKDMKNRKVIYFCIIIFIFAIHFGAEQTAYTPFLKENLGLNLIEIGFFLSGVVFFLVLSGYVCGYLVDKKKVRKKNLLAYSMFVSGVGGILFVLTENPIWSFVFRSLHEIGDGGFLISISIGIVSLFDKKRIGGNAGFIGFVVILATITGALISGPMGFKYGYQYPNIVTGLLSVVAFFMFLFFNRRRK